MRLKIAVALLAGLLFATNAIAEEVVIPGTGDGVAVLKSVGEAFTQKTGNDVIIPKSIGSGGAVKVAGADKVALGACPRIATLLQSRRNWPIFSLIFV